jgi:hypothetical protein
LPKFSSSFPRNYEVIERDGWRKKAASVIADGPSEYVGDVTLGHCA